MFATADSVVSNVEATDVAFCRALLVTLTGSRIPDSTMSTYSSVAALKPVPGADSVSYTHLDVYKRQSQTWDIAPTAAGIPIALSAPSNADPTAVAQQ